MSPNEQVRDAREQAQTAIPDHNLLRAEQQPKAARKPHPPRLGRGSGRGGRPSAKLMREGAAGGRHRECMRGIRAAWFVSELQMPFRRYRAKKINRARSDIHVKATRTLDSDEVRPRKSGLAATLVPRKERYPVLNSTRKMPARPAVGCDGGGGL